MKRAKPPELPEIADKPGWDQRFQRGLQRVINTPHKPITPKSKERTASKGRVHKGSTELGRNGASELL
jgi:hypothetical protein